MNILGINIFRGGIRIVGAILCNFIYRMISWMYQLFITVARLNILTGSDTANKIYQRITLILVIVMTFYITFEFVKYIISPDTLTDKEKGVGNLGVKLVMVIVLIAIVPNIFSIAYKFQNAVIENQVLSKIILGKTDKEFGSLGGEFSADLLRNFYKLDPNVCADQSKVKCDEAQKQIDNNLDALRKVNQDTEGSFDLTSNLTEAEGDTPIIRFDGILAIVVGGFVLYILAMYSIDVGSRYAQLIFLQLIAPIAIIGYMLPKKDGIFQKWCKQSIVTYVDLFIRLAIIYFVLLLLNVIGGPILSGEMFIGIGEEVSETIKIFSYIAVVMGLLMFAYRAPKLLEELFPKMGASGIGFGLKSKDRLEPTSKAIKGVAGATSRVVGGVAGLATGVATGVAATGLKGANKGWSIAKAAVQGAKTGAGKKGGIRKGMQAARDSVNKDLDIVDKGGTPLGSDFGGGMAQHRMKKEDRTIAGYDEVTKRKEAVSKNVKEIKVLKQLETLKETAESTDQTLALRLTGDIKKVEKAARAYAADNSAANRIALEAAITAAAQGTALEQNLANIPNHMQDIMEVGSDKWSTIKTSIDEAQRIATSTIGTEVVNGQSVESMDASTFARNLGDISDHAVSMAEKARADEKYRKDKANASGASSGSK